LNNNTDNPKESLISKFWNVHGKNIKYFMGIATSAALSALAKSWMDSQKDDTIEE